MVEFLSPNKGKVNGPNMYLARASAMHAAMGLHYDSMVRICNDQVPYSVPDLEANDVTQADDPGMEGLSTANLNAIRVSAITAHAEKKIELRDELPKFFNDIRLKICVIASQVLNGADGEWDAAKSDKDPNALVTVVHRTDFTHVGGVTLPVAKIKMQKSLIAFEQGKIRNISEFKKEFDTLVWCMRGANIAEMDHENSAIWFR